ncbi:probable small intestine urate exporter isoform X2 [Choloepus didactylus]|uniref:probable small intestine urate exporter isoform X2 n=1 Tax=Choloepus didactylus TaxID=27675 RepID=UPI00189D6C77|nr:probable small intestine urate exporter isoform X2 [Choloepus didactylus]
MPTPADTQATARGVSNHGNSHMAQMQASRKGFCSVRHGLAFILQLCNSVVFAQNVDLSIAMPAMVNNIVPPNQSNDSTERPPTDYQDYWNETLKEFKAVAPVYDWSPEIQGIILSSAHYGSILAPIPSGYVAGIYGAKYVVGAGLFISSIMTLLIPLAADAGVTWLVVILIIQGIAQVTVMTGQYSVWTKWAPPMERSQLNSIASSGILLGTFIVLLTGGEICQTMGWPNIFYIFGGIGCACCLLWFSLIFDDPMNHPFISTDEKEYIICSLAQQSRSPGWSLPFKAMLKSLPLWAIIVSYFCRFWGSYTLTAYTPTYLSSELQVNLKDSGILSSLPFLAGFIFIILGGMLADFLLSRKILRLITIRKLFTTIGVLISVMLTASLYWVRSSLSTTTAFLVLSAATSAFCVSGSMVNILDIAPRYASFLRGLSHMSSFAAGAISPTVAGFLLGLVGEELSDGE